MLRFSPSFVARLVCNTKSGPLLRKNKFLLLTFSPSSLRQFSLGGTYLRYGSSSSSIRELGGGGIFVKSLCPLVRATRALSSGPSSSGNKEKTSESTSSSSGEILTGDTHPSEDNMHVVLNVAEKNDAAKRIAGFLSNGTAQTRNTYSTYNKIYQFRSTYRGNPCEMIVTSVSGHLLSHEFDGQFRGWRSCDPADLFHAPITTYCSDDYKPILRTLEEQAPKAKTLVIWTDCDREGEAIGFQIIDVCTRRNRGLEVYRATFSELTARSVQNAWRNLGRPNKQIADAVRVRQELDLRIGAAFTRFQTIKLKDRCPQILTQIVSYGPCQFPTLGFVVERYMAIKDFIPESFWKIEVMHKVGDLSVNFNWARVRLFNENVVKVLWEKCLDNRIATVMSVVSRPKSKWRPVALDTVEFEKLSSRKLRISAKEAMKIAEKLYNRGLISYPRTETNIFPESLDLRPLVEAQTESPAWGQFAGRVNQDGPTPRNGKNTDKAHPPIHPVKFETLQGNEARIYELIARHFLACCSKDAVGTETTVEIEIAEEKFVAHGLHVLERNYLEVYIYDKWSDKEIPRYQQGETFDPTKIDMTASETTPPNLLTEADLITLMEKHGIGTDATHAEHIETVQNRDYVAVNDGKFHPMNLGMALVEGYDSMGFAMSKPHLRAELEADLKLICDGRKDPRVVLEEHIRKYKEVFLDATDQVQRLHSAVTKFVVRGEGFDDDDDGDDNAPPPRPPPAPMNPPPPRNRGGGSGTRGPARRGGGGPRGGGRGYGPGRPPDDDDDDDDQGQPPPPRGGGRGAPSRSGTFGAGPVHDSYNQNQRSNFSTASSSGVSSGFGSFNSTRSFSSSNATVRDDSYSDATIPCDCCPPKQISMRTIQNERWKQRQFYQCSECGFNKTVLEIPNQNPNLTSAPSLPSYSGGSSNFSSSSSHNLTPRMPPVNASHRYTPYPAQPPADTFRRPVAPVSNNRNSQNMDEDGIPLCRCGQSAVSRKVKKEGPNNGKLFFACGKNMTDPSNCGFFQWDEDGIGAMQDRGTYSGAGGFSTQARPQQRSKNNNFGSKKGFNSKGGGKGRKCGVCREYGHNKKNCPVAASRGPADDEDEEMDY